MNHPLGNAGLWTDIARTFLRKIGDPPAPLDAFELAYCADVPVYHGALGRTDGVAIYVPRRAARRDRHWIVAHELAHILLLRTGERQSEAAASSVALELMLPLVVAARDVRELGNSVRAMSARHVNCPTVAIVARLSSLGLPSGARLSNVREGVRDSLQASA